jgi:signal transduction histidine kinase
VHAGTLPKTVRLPKHEALSKVARHAGATTMEIAAEVTDKLLTLRVIDNGRGIDPAVTRRSGVANLCHRAEQFGGTLTLGPHRPTGAVVEWTVPLPEVRPWPGAVPQAGAAAGWYAPAELRQD